MQSRRVKFEQKITIEIENRGRSYACKTLEVKVNTHLPKSRHLQLSWRKK